MTDPTHRLNAALEGRYRIERQLGEGGMATVYLADDLRHERKVALKVLKPELAAVVGAERFLAEIKTTANLQHPHILPLFDSGEADGFLFYVMPNIEGETLAGRIARDKQLPVGEAVRIAVAVANALQTAHEAGVVHRDIKPGNILLSRGEPLVADFGIALAVGAAGGSRLTETGLSLGTPYYMSPEQATGDQNVGAASDTYSLACVLYEMLIGEPPYLGNTAQAVLGKIIQGQPVSATATRKSVPPNVDAAIRKALEKLPADRFATTEDFARALGDASFRYGGEAVGAGAAGGRPRWLTVAQGGLTLGLALLAAWALSRPTPPRMTMRFNVDAELPGFVAAQMSLAMPADGSFLIHGTGPSNPFDGGLVVHRFDGLPGTPVATGGPAFHPTVSPDGTDVAYISPVDGSLHVVSVAGGSPRLLVRPVACCAHWAHDGFIYYVGVGDSGVSRIPATGGGEPETILAGSPSTDSIAAFPRLSRSGETLLVLGGFLSGAAGRLEAVRLADGTRAVLAAGVTSPAFHTPTGHLVYADAQGRLVATRFDERSLALDGAPITLAEGLLAAPWATIAVSEAGTVAYVTGSAAVGEVQPVWVDRRGVAEVIDPDWTFGFTPPGGNRGVAISPDGSRVAVSVFAPNTGGDIYVKELPRGPFSRLTSTVNEETRPRWTPDGESVTYLGGEPSGYRGFRIRADLATTEATPITDVGVFEVEVASGNVWIASRGMDRATMNLRAQRLDDGTERFDLGTDFVERAISVSPDGRWIAHESDETGRTEIYVRSFPELTRSKRQVSPSGGTEPRWGRTGRELFYIDAERRMVSVSVEAGEDLRLGERTALFQVPPDVLTAAAGEFYALYDLDVDDQRFLMLRSTAAPARPKLVVMLNAFELLKRR